jgi:hypothetical protein
LCPVLHNNNNKTIMLYLTRWDNTILKKGIGQNFVLKQYDSQRYSDKCAAHRHQNHF